MITASGIRIAPETKTTPSPEDVAVHMTRITRYGGAIWCPLIMHSALVGELVWRELLERKEDFDFQTFAWSLLHDAHEVVTGEVPRPWKPAQMKDHQRDLDFLIADAYRVDLRKVDLKLVKAMDERALLIEALTLELPGFREIYQRQELAGDRFPNVPEDQLKLGSKVVGSSFWDVDNLNPLASSAVRTFARVLEMVKSGDQVGGARTFRLMFDRVVVDGIRS